MEGTRRLDPEMEHFLSEVDEIMSLVEGMNSDDASVRENATQKADERIARGPEQVEGCRTIVNHTLINSNPSSSTHQTEGAGETSQDSFLRSLATDAEERAKIRKKNKKLAGALKEKGNMAFGQGDYEVAVRHYSEGLDKLRDFEALYTNRAQAYIKLEKYQEAITDCDWALKCNENSIKAYVHMGKANLGLKNYKEARECYQKILTIDPKQEKLVKEYASKLELAERKEQQEKEAQEEFERGNVNSTTVCEVLKKLGRVHRPAFFYLGGLNLLTELMTDCTEQTLFRTNGGFGVVNDNEIIRGSLNSPIKQPHEEALCVSVLLLWQAVCRGNEENQRVLMSSPGVSQLVMDLLSCEQSGILRECVELLSLYSQSQHGRNALVGNVDLTRMLQLLVGFVTGSDATADRAAGILTDLAQEEKYKSHFQKDCVLRVLPPFETLLKNVKMANKRVMPQCISFLGSLVADKGIRKQLAASEGCWEACLVAVDDSMSSISVKEYSEILYTLLGLMVNLSLEQCSALQGKAVAITERCVSLLDSTEGGILTRATGLLSHVLPQSDEAVEKAVEAGIVKKMVKFMKVGGQQTTRYAIKTLAACTRGSQQARAETVKCDKKLSALTKLLTSEDEMVVGNAALCLGHCLGEPGAATALLASDIVRILLTLAGGDARESALQQNSAIALGKLCTADPRHMAQLRELNGLAILSSCMKYIK
ncbi:tetratricopeptide repeat protein 12 isoform X2 [Callorhinchus milii]|nr:tetratricopeptide repeat protein 12 isoform X2 [Callorhinchus milii]|eukprot:gi/632980347/ref/XP_007906983.1/ PREDICTED: tetratricopeptide repeat protein 12 [Callorhinchus milii]